MESSDHSKRKMRRSMKGRATNLTLTSVVSFRLKIASKAAHWMRIRRAQWGMMVDMRRVASRVLECLAEEATWDRVV